MIMTIDEHAHIEVFGRLIIVKRFGYTSIIKCPTHTDANRFLEAVYIAARNHSDHT